MTYHLIVIIICTKLRHLYNIHSDLTRLIRYYYYIMESVCRIYSQQVFFARYYTKKEEL